MHRVFLTLVFIGIFHSGLSHSSEIPAVDELPPPGKVIVEPTHVNETSTGSDYELQPYDQRRGDWGVTVGLDYNSFEPENYSPNFVELAYGDVYDRPSLPNVGFEVAVKRNFSLGSLGMEFGFSTFKVDAMQELIDQQITDSSLSLYMLRLGAQYNMDRIFSKTPHPFLVPYVAGGLYTVFFRETNASTSFNGNTQVAPYATAGIAMSLDWLDPDASRSGYQESGMESSFLFAEVRQLFETQDDSDPDFTTDVPTWGVGIKVEF